MVRGGARGPRLPYRGFYVWSDEKPRGEAGRPRLPRQGGLQLGVGRGGRAVVPAPLLLRPARPQHGQPGRCATRSPRSWASGSSRASRASGWTPCRSCSSRWGCPEDAFVDPHELLRDLRRYLGRRRGDASLLGEVNLAAGRPAHVLRRRGRRRAAHDLRLRLQPGDVPRARPRGRDAAARRARVAAGDPRGLPVGELRAQPRRAHARQALRGRARGGVRRVRARRGPAALRARPAAAPAGHARRRPAPHPARLLARLLAAGHAGALLRRGDRHGREPRARGPDERALADAVVARAPRRLHDRGRAVPAARRRRPLRARRRSTSPTSAATRTRC